MTDSELRDYRAHICERYIQLQHLFIPPDARDFDECMPKSTEKIIGGPIRDELRRRIMVRSVPSIQTIDMLNGPAMLHRLVLGPTGSGKSTLAHNRLLEWANDGVRPVPILIEMRHFYMSGREEFLDYLENDDSLTILFQSRDIRARLAAGDAEIIFDGLDEIIDPAACEAITRQIASCAGEFPRARILVTSHFASNFGAILSAAGFGIWLLDEFDDKKIAAFLDQWILNTVAEPHDRQIVRERMDHLCNNLDIRKLAQNPFLLSVFAVLACKYEISCSLLPFYTLVSDHLVEAWDVNIGAANVVLDSLEKRRLLRDLAWKMYREGRRFESIGNFIDQQEVEDSLNASLLKTIPDTDLRKKAVKQLIDQFTSENNIFCHTGGVSFGFIHQCFLEYFASEHLVQVFALQPETAYAEVEQIYQSHSSSNDWHGVLMLAAIRMEPMMADQILCPLLEDTKLERSATGHRYWGLKNFELVTDVIQHAEEPQKLDTTCARIRSLLKDWIQSGCGKQWLNHLARYFPDNNTRAFLTKLIRRDTDTSTECAAIEILANHFPDQKTRALLTEVALRTGFALIEKEKDTRRSAVTSLTAHFRDDETRLLFMNLARRDEDSNAQVQVVTDLAENFRDQETRAILTELALGKHDGQVREQAILSLGQHFNDSETHALMLEIVHRHDGSMARVCAAAFISKYAPSDEVRTILTDLAFTGGEHEDDHARRGSVVLLAMYYRNASETFDALTKLAGNENGWEIIRSAGQYADSEEKKYISSILSEVRARESRQAQ